MRTDTGLGLWVPVLLVAGTIALLGGLLTRALSGGLRRPAALAALVALLGTVAWGALDEFHQSFVPGRSAAASDLAADAAGAALGVVAVAVLGATRRAAVEPLAVVLISGPGCPLCDEARQALARIGRQVPLALEERSIAEDDELRRLYGDEIPVVLVGGRRVARGRIDAGRLRASLRWRLTESA